MKRSLQSLIACSLLGRVAHASDLRVPEEKARAGVAASDRLASGFRCPVTRPLCLSTVSFPWLSVQCLWSDHAERSHRSAVRCSVLLACLRQRRVPACWFLAWRSPQASRRSLPCGRILHLQGRVGTLPAPYAFRHLPGRRLWGPHKYT